MNAPAGIDRQPVTHVHWVETSELRANGFNPNRMAPPELHLLKVSILENGWTMPIVIGDDNEIIDGYHRWTLARTDSEVNALTLGLIPVVTVLSIDPATRRMATVRHNRARGAHHVIKMSDLVKELADLNISESEIGRRLQMSTEEVTRLLARARSPKLRAGDEFSKGWMPDPDA